MIFTLSCIFRYLQIPNRAGTGVQYRTECHGRRGRDTGPSGKGAEQRVDLFGRDLRGLCFSGPFVRIHQRQESPKRDLAQGADDFRRFSICSNHHRGSYTSPALAAASYPFVDLPPGNTLRCNLFPSSKFTIPLFLIVAGYSIIKSTTNWNFAKERFQ